MVAQSVQVFNGLGFVRRAAQDIANSYVIEIAIQLRRDLVPKRSAARAGSKEEAIIRLSDDDLQLADGRPMLSL
jgi:hypothetical protein